MHAISTTLQHDGATLSAPSGRHTVTLQRVRPGVFRVAVSNGAEVDELTGSYPTEHIARTIARTATQALRAHDHMPSHELIPHVRALIFRALFRTLRTAGLSERDRQRIYNAMERFESAEQVAERNAFAAELRAVLASAGGVR